MTAVVFTVTDTAGPIPIVGNGGVTSPSFTGGQNVVTPGGLRAVVKTITTNNGTYTAAGDALSAASLGLSTVLFAKIDGTNSGFIHQYDTTNNVVFTFMSAGSSGAFASADATAAGTKTLRCFAIGY